MELVGQDSVVEPGLTVLEQVLAGCGEKRELLLRFSAVSETVAREPDNATAMKELGALSERMDEEGAWGLEQQCQEVLQRLGISDLHRPVEDLSGGTANAWDWPRPWWPALMCFCSMNRRTTLMPPLWSGCRAGWIAIPERWCW